MRENCVRRDLMETQAIDDDLNDDVLDRGQIVALLDYDGTHFSLFEGDNIVGRSNKKDLDVILQDDTVSDLHANLEISESGECYCKDLASNNGRGKLKARIEKNILDNFRHLLFPPKLLQLRNFC